MNAQQSTSLVNLISAQPAKPASSAQPDTNAPRFSEVLGNQRSQQPKPSQNAQNKPTDSANAASQPASEARPSSESSTTTGNDQAQQAAATQQSGSNPGTGASTQADAGAAVEPTAENATAMAMSDLAAAVAQVFLNRTTQANPTLDAQDNDNGPIAGRRPGADLNLSGSELPGKASADLAMRSGSNANTATEGLLKS